MCFFKNNVGQNINIWTASTTKSSFNCWSLYLLVSGLMTQEDCRKNVFVKSTKSRMIEHLIALMTLFTKEKQLSVILRVCRLIIRTYYVLRFTISNWPPHIFELVILECLSFVLWRTFRVMVKTIEMDAALQLYFSNIQQPFFLEKNFMTIISFLEVKFFVWCIFERFTPGI